MKTIQDAKFEIPKVQLGLNAIFLILLGVRAFLYFSTLGLFITCVLLNIILSLTYIIIERYGFIFDILLNVKKFKLVKIANKLNNLIQ